MARFILDIGDDHYEGMDVGDMVVEGILSNYFDSVSATEVEEDPFPIEDANARLQRVMAALRKVAGWNGTDISDLIEDGLLEEGDL